MTTISRAENPGSPTSPLSLTSSMTSETSLQSLASKSALVQPAPELLPLPAYVAFAAASQLATDNHIAHARQDGVDSRNTLAERSSALFTEQALKLINAFLDDLLYSFLSSARSMSSAYIQNAVENVLKGKLAQLATEAALAEMQDLLSEEEAAEAPQTPQEEDSLPQEEIDLIFQRTRLRIMVYMRLGEMEDEDEERYVQRESAFDSGKRFSQSSRMVPWSAAIFLTSVLEFIAEQCINISAENAYRRVRSRRANMQTGSPAPDDERVYVDEHDVEKLALSSVLSRLWRIWRKHLRNRPRSRAPMASQAPRTRHSSGREATSGQVATTDFADDEQRLGSSNEDSDVLPKAGIAVTTTSLPHPALRKEAQSEAGNHEDTDSDAVGRPALSKISEDERSHLAESRTNSNPALFPLTYRSSLHSHPAFDAANYPPEIAAAAGLEPKSSNLSSNMSIPTDITDDDPFDLNPPGPVRHEPWARNVAERVLGEATFQPSQNAFAAQARAAEQASRSRPGTASSIASGDRSLNMENQAPQHAGLQPAVDSRVQPKLHTPAMTPSESRKGSVNVSSPNNMISPTDSDYSTTTPVIGIAEQFVAQPIKAHTITPPRSQEALPRSTKIPPIQEEPSPPNGLAQQTERKTPLKIPRDLIKTPSPGSGGKKSNLQARSPTVDGESIQDFADFIRSTAPNGNQTRIPPVINTSKHIGAHNQPTSTSSPAGLSKPLPKLPQQRAAASGFNTSNSSVEQGQDKRLKTSLQPRDAVVRNRGTDDLIEFLREGPPTPNNESLISKDSPGASTLDRNGSIVTPSTQGSVGSSAPLLARPAGALRPATQSNNAGSAPQRTRRRPRDPYALPSSDEDEDDDDTDTGGLTALPGRNSRRREKHSGNEESFLDFLKNTEPPSSRSGPTSSMPSNVHRGAASSTARPTSNTTSATTPKASSPITPQPPTFSSTRNSLNHNRSRGHSPAPSAVLSMSAYSSTQPPTAANSSAPQLPEFMAAPPITFDLNDLNKRDPMLAKYNDFDGAAPAPTVSRDRNSKFEGSSRGGKKGSGFWRRFDA